MSGKFGVAGNGCVPKSVEWYTPAWIFDGLDLTFDVDPCSPLNVETAVPANIKYTTLDDGLAAPWAGRVWLNPPYGKDTRKWMDKMALHGNGIALVFSRTDAAWFQDAMRACTAMLLIAGRISFIPGVENAHKKSRCGAGSALFAWGGDCANALKNISDRGVYIQMTGK